MVCRMAWLHNRHYYILFCAELGMAVVNRASSSIPTQHITMHYLYNHLLTTMYHHTTNT